MKTLLVSVVALSAIVVTSSGADGIAVEKGDRVLKFTVNGKPMFTYQMEPGPVPEGVSPNYAHGGYLHPVFTPDGKLVTADFPPDHKHQRGIFFAWTKTEFEGRHPDFWNMGKGEQPGAKLQAEVRFSKLEKSWGGEKAGGFVSQHRFIDHGGESAKDMLHEQWEVMASRIETNGRAANALDLVSTQTCASNSPVLLPKYHYGGLGVRGSAQWDPVEAVTMLTSEGKARKEGDASKAKWVYLGGEVDGQPAGIAVLMHPSNFRFPQPLRLNPKNPQICVAPSQDGDWSIEPGKPYVSRYRIVAFDGEPDAAWFEKLWQDYANAK